MSAKFLLQKYSEVINRHDFDLIEPLLSQECSFWFSSGTFTGLAQARKAFEKTWAAIQNEVYTITDINWLIDSESAAICTYSFHWEGIVRDERRAGSGRGTSCFRVETSDWKLVHEHLSAFPQS
jgi:ketosteroid isomerase-like protein